MGKKYKIPNHLRGHRKPIDPHGVYRRTIRLTAKQFKKWEKYGPRVIREYLDSLPE